MRPSAPPLLFWNVRASTTCSRETLPIFVSTRPIGRPWSWSIGGIVPVDEAGRAEAPPPETPTGLAPPADGTVTLDGGRSPGDGFIGAGVAPGRTAAVGGVGFLPGSGAGVAGGVASVRDMMSSSRLSSRSGEVVGRRGWRSTRRGLLLHRRHAGPVGGD